jgi:hypothetical protein
MIDFFVFWLMVGDNDKQQVDMTFKSQVNEFSTMLVLCVAPCMRVCYCLVDGYGQVIGENADMVTHAKSVSSCLKQKISLLD